MYALCGMQVVVYSGAAWLTMLERRDVELSLIGSDSE